MRITESNFINVESLKEGQAISALYEYLNITSENVLHWGYFIKLTSIFWVSLFILILGLTLPQKPKYIKVLNLTAAYYIAIIVCTTSYDYFLREDVISDLGYSNIWESVNFTWYPNPSYFSFFFFLLASIAVICLLLGISDKLFSIENNKIEFLLLVLFIWISSILLLTIKDFVNALILLECTAFSSYILVGFERKNKFSSSSGIKYLILGSVPGGLFVLGITLLYKNFGTFYWTELQSLSYFSSIISEGSMTSINLDWNTIKDMGISQNLLDSGSNNVLYDKIADNSNTFISNKNSGESLFDSFYYNSVFASVYVAVGLIFVNLLFKLTGAPFHMWAPSVYGGSPLGTVSFLSVFSKLTIIFFSIYVYIYYFYLFEDIIHILLISCGVLSILCAIMGAFSEKLIKRFFVYSSMGHVGYMLLGIASPDILGTRAVLDYLIIYVFSSYIMWFTLMYLTRKTTHLTNLKALYINHPMLSLIFSMTLFSLSGLPPLAGFFVKFEIFYNLINNGYYFLVLGLFILTVFSFFYYLRIMKIIYFENNTIFKKNKNEDVLKLRVISILFHLIIFALIFITEPFLYTFDNILLQIISN